MQNYFELVQKLIDTSQDKLNLELFVNYKRAFARKYKMKDLPSNIAILKSYRDMIDKKIIKKNIELEQFLKKRKIRSASGIVAIQVLTKPFRCPGECIFCPNDPTMPKSYIKSEPGAMRALLNKFDPLKQVYNRLTSLTLSGHPTDKIEMIVLGGTWDVYPKRYKIEFIKGLYDAANTFSELKIINDKCKINFDSKDEKRFKYTLEGLDKVKYSKTLEDAIKKNEKAEHRIIGLTIETRPEYVTDENCKLRREMGVTRIEIGLQSMYDDVLKANKRGHTVQQFRDAIHKLRQYAFKFSIHIMPGLYGSTYAKDLGTFKKIYSDIYVKPDEIKFYPTSVIPDTELYNLYQQGKYKPISTDYIKKLIGQTFNEIIPPYTRIKRLIRDIPATEIVAGSNITNLSQLTHDNLKLKMGNDKLKMNTFYKRLYSNLKILNELTSYELKNFIEGKKETLIVGSKPDLKTFRNFVSLDTRSREIRHKISDDKKQMMSDDKINLVIRKYESSVGIELFISFEDIKGYLYGFARLLLPQNENTIDWKGLGEDIAMIRELHVYGNVETLKRGNVKTKNGKFQHKGFGKQLMEIAENISKIFGYKKLSVISGVGVREYYKKLGYTLKGTYMVKRFKCENV